MVTVKQQAKHKPVRLSEEDKHLLKDWVAPNVSDQMSDLSGKTNVVGRPLEWYEQQAELEEEIEEELAPLTAEEIEAVRLAAYEEGLAQGKEAGFEAGYQEGREQGYQDGLTQGNAEGKKQGIEEGQIEIAAKAQVWSSLAEQLSEPLRELDEHVEKQLVNIAAQLAEAVIGVELEMRPEIILHTLKESVAALPIAEAGCNIQLNPSDAALIKEVYGDEELVDRGWQIIEEPTVEPGGCIVESRTSAIDQTLKERIKFTLTRFLKDAGLVSDDDHLGF